MASKIDIASNALLLLGDSPITSFSEGGTGATVMANIYEPTYRAMLASHPWNFAQKQQQLSQLVGKPLFDRKYRYRYAMPPDYIRIIRLESQHEYQIVGEEIHTNDNQAKIQYVYEISEGDLPPYFVVLMEYQLAAKAAMAVTDRSTLADMMMAKAMNQFSQSTAIDSQNDTTVAIQDNPFISIRG